MEIPVLPRTQVRPDRERRGLVRLAGEL